MEMFSFFANYRTYSCNELGNCKLIEPTKSKYLSHQDDLYCIIATPKGTDSYFTQKVKNPTGMTGAFFPSGYNNVFFSKPRSMARFGLLMLNQGNWNGNQII